MEPWISVAEFLNGERLNACSTQAILDVLATFDFEMQRTVGLPIQMKFQLSPINSCNCEK